MSVVRTERSSKRTTPYGSRPTKAWTFGNVLSIFNPLNAFRYANTGQDPEALDNKAQLAKNSDTLRTDHPQQLPNEQQTISALFGENLHADTTQRDTQVLLSTPSSAPSAPSSPWTRPTSLPPSKILEPPLTQMFGSMQAESPTPMENGTHLTPSRTLSRNPNGSYLWTGAGSAKAKRVPQSPRASPRSNNRYSSPAFGPSRSTSEHLVLRESDIATGTPKSDNKRRKVGEDLGSIVAVPGGIGTSNGRASSINVVPFPAMGSPASPRATGSKLTPTPSRLQPVTQKPTTPINPSPLRQAWSRSSSSNSQNEGGNVKPTETANYLASLIQDATPPKKPDVSNPYQTASPVRKPAPKRVRKPIRKPATPNSNTDLSDGQLQNFAREKQKATSLEISPVAIIEATLPKGSKRSRPPVFENQTAPLHRPVVQLEREVVAMKSGSVVNAKDDEESEKTVKRTKILTKDNDSTPGKRAPAISTAESEKSSEVFKEKPASSPIGPSRAFPSMKTNSKPKEPSKLRYSYRPETGTEVPVSPEGESPLAEKNSYGPSPVEIPLPPVAPNRIEISEVNDSIEAVVEAGPIQRSKEVPRSVLSLPPPIHVLDPPLLASENKGKEKESTMLIDPKHKALAALVNDLPPFTFPHGTQSTWPVDIVHVSARNIVKAVTEASLSKYDFTAARETPAITVTQPAPAFDWAAAGLKPSSRPQGMWNCSLCGINNSDTRAKCEICESPR